MNGRLLAMITINKRPMNKRQRNIICRILFAVLLLVNGAAMAQRSGDQHVSVGGKVFGGGKKANVSGSSTVMIDQAGAIVGSDVYGGGEMAKVNTTDGSTLTNGKSTHVTLRVGTVQGSLYGGGLGVRPSGDDPGTRADVFGPVQVTINGGTVVGNVFGCNNLFGAPQTTVVVDVLKDPSNVTMSLQNVYGGGNQADYSNSGYDYPEVNIKHGTVGGSVFGGGLGVTATVTGNPQVTIGDNVENHTAVVSGKVYGGGDEAAVIGSTTVTVQNAHSQVWVDVYGGGNQADVLHSTTVHINNGTIGQDVYGGGAFAHVGTDGNDNTTVNVLGGTVTRDVYGGGLGCKEEGQPGETGYVAPIAAAVNGVVTVNIGALTGALENGFAPSSSVTGSATIGGSVFGCNNSNGTPKDNVTVHIYKTAHTTGVNTVSDQGFAIAQVFGGGNQAHYQPTSTGKKATVHIWTCDNTIGFLYGGGNAADVGTNEGIGSATDVIIDGGRIEWVFGGGNGAGDDNPGANIYGNVGVSYHAGIITYLFGGSNEKGDITGSKTVSVLNDGPCVGNQITELYGGSNLAPLNGDVSLTMSCHPNSDNCQIGTIFGGSRNANINGNVTLTIEGGLYNYAFGGNNIGGTINGNVTLNLYGGTINEAAFGGNKGGGSITGDITVKVEDHCSCPLEVKDVFGAGDQAMYTAPTSSGAREFNPLVYINNMCNDHTITGNVYGGGNGDPTNNTQEPGMVTGNPKVIIGDLTTGNENYVAAISGNVYGGGNAAKVVGNTTVLMQKANSTVGHDIYGGGNLANVSGSVEVEVTGGTVTQDVYGGGALADVNVTDGAHTIGTTTTVTLTDGTVRNIYGGGLGSRETGNVVEAKVFGPVQVTVDGGTVYDVFGCNNQNGAPQGTVQVNINNNVSHNVYGGGNLAAYSNSGNSYPIVNINNGTVANVFGGGLGSTAVVTANPQVTIGDNTDSHNAIVSGNVYGGGDAAAVTGNTTVTYNDNGSTSQVSNVFGGGNQAGVSGTATVTMTLGHVTTGLYGGCNTSGNVGGDITVNVTGGTIGANGEPAYFHGGGYGNGTSTSGDVDVTINGATVVIWGDVYGGSAKGNVNAAGKETNVTLNSGTIHGDLYGGGLGDGTYAALVNGAVQVTVNGGTVTGSIYGCNNVNGAPQSTVKVDIYDTDHPGSGFAIGHVFGGGNAADFGGKPQVTIHNCDNSIEYVYGGGNAATVTGTEVLVYGGNSIGNVFGGCYGADVTTGGTDVKIRGGKIGKVFGGNNHHGSITGNIKVDIDKQIEPGDGHTLCDMIIGEVYGGGNEAPSQAGAITIGCTGDIVPGANGHIAHPENIGTTLEGIGKVYGGANKASITSGDISLNIKSGIVGTVFGGNNISGEIANAIQVKINKTGDACGWYVGDVYGGGDQAWYGGTPVVRIQNGTVYGNVYGGGNNITIDNKGVAASDVEMTGGTVLGGVYGGCNLKGYVVGNSVVNILGGTIGSQDLLDLNKTADVFGGGLGEQTRVNGNVTVTISRATGENPPAAPTIYGDVYGGSALGNVNTQNGGNTTTVNIYDGTLITKRTSTTENGQTIYYYTGGNVFGGGLGRKADPANNITAIPAKVYGAVTVNIGAGTPGPQEDGTHFTGNATIGGNIYGANNTNGSPQDDITVNVYRTAHTDGTGGTVDNTVNGTAFAIANVFGGGNEANYAPQNGAQNTTKKSKVNIYGCYNTINRVFGGGNAASTPSVWTEIQGGRFYQVFGGGNGERGASYGADINGRLDLFIHGGNVGQFYGASNQNGNISPGPINVVVDSNGPCGSNLTIDEFFCGGNFADINTNLETTIDCSNGMQVNNLYGGCNQANISGHVILNLYGGTYINVYGGSKGDTITLGPNHINKRADIGEYVTLNLYGGTITNVYGGSNVNGNIKGAITVNVIDNEGDCPLYITNIYGGSNMTSYKPTDATIQSPVVNVVHAKYGISGNVYGGSKGVVGSAAVVKANPLVNIGYDSSMSGYIPSAYNVSSYNRMTTIQGSVFGGCDAAKVIGNTEVQLKKGARVIGNVYGGGNMGEVEGDTKVIVNGKME